MRVPLILCWCIAMLAALAPWPVRGACAPKFPFCQSRPSRTDQTVAIFVGTLKSVTMPTITPAVPLRGRQTSEAEIISGRNHIRLPIQSASSVPVNDKRYPVAKLEVTENFIGAMSSEFTVHLTSDVFLGSIPQGVPAFTAGGVWRVEAYYDAHVQQWMTSTCQRTRPLLQASDDLQALRAWMAGNRLPGRIQGQVANPNKGGYVSGVHVALHGVPGRSPRRPTTGAIFHSKA